jgi:hypothetical protein
MPIYEKIPANSRKQEVAFKGGERLRAGYVSV